MAESMQLRVVLALAERVVAPLKNIQKGSSDTAKAFKDARDQLRELEGAQKSIEGFGNARLQMQALQRDMQQLTLRRNDYNDKLLDERTKHGENAAALRTAREAHRRMTQAVERGAQVTPEFARQLELVRDKLQASEKAHYRSTAAMRRAKEGIAATSREMGGLRGKLENTQARMQGYQERLEKAGISTDKLGQASAGLQVRIERETAALQKQQQALERLGRVEQMRARLTERHSQTMMRLAKWGGAGALMQMGGQKINQAMLKPVQAFADAEEAQTQLRISFMQKDGSVVPEYQQILAKAEELGDRLPGTTADFIRMMTVLRQEGMSAKAVLGGLGDAAANLGVLLGAGPEEAAAKMAKMQDSLRATEDEMGEVADLMQRAKYLGADMSFMQSAIGNAAPVMDIMKTQGAEAMRMLAPMAVMMNQAGMEDGGSVGNAVRKIHDRAMNSKKVAKANAAMKAAGAGARLDFTDGKGEFGGLEKLFAQLAKLRKLSTADRGLVMNALWGDDAETNRVLTKWINDNLDGYSQTVEKMKAQADLQQRVNEQLGTLKSVADAAGGSYSNLLKELGASIAPELKALLNGLGELARAVGTWAKEHPTATKAIMLTVAAIGAFLAVAGMLTLGVVAVLGPLTMARLLLGKWALGLFGMRAAAAAAGPAMGMLYQLGFMAGRAFAFLRGGAALLLGGLRALAVFLIANPIVAAFALLATAAYMVWRNWDGIKGGLLAIWQQLSGAVSAWWASTAAGAAALWQSLVGLKDRFFSAGADLMSGLMNGITSRLAAVREAVVGAADAVGAWFREKLGINSPSRVFMQYGGWISEGAALGIAGSQGAVRNAALGMATAATLAMPLAADAAALRLDTRPPLGAPMAQASAGGGGNTYTITINPAPGMDAQAIARAVSAELERRERAQQSRRLSALHDID